MKISSIVLAAGNSSRFINSNKLLSNIDGFKIIELVVKVILKTNFKPCFIITGFDNDKIYKSLSNYNVNFVYNKNWSAGLSSSLKSGITKIEKVFDGTLISLGDMPFISTKTLNEMKREFLFHNGNFIICPQNKNQIGNPIILPKKYFHYVHDLKGDNGFKKIIKKNPNFVKTIEINSNEIFQDFDTEKQLIDYEQKP